MNISPNAMVRSILLIIVFSFITDALHAQLVSWRDLIGGELPQPDERIWYGPDSLQFGELWIPEEDPLAAVILIHGGCWLDIYPGVEIMNHMANSLREAGFTVWNVEYRRLGHEGGGYPGTFLDVSAGADYLLQIGERYNLPTGNVIVAGHSAGGHLATWLAGRKNIDPSSLLYSSRPILVQGVISLAGINDLERYASYGASTCGENTVERLVDLDSRGEDAYLDTSPLHLLPLGVTHAEVSAAFDAPVPPFFGYHFKQALSDAGDSSVHVVLANAGHFEMITPWSEEWNRVLRLFTVMTYVGN